MTSRNKRVAWTFGDVISSRGSVYTKVGRDEMFLLIRKKIKLIKTVIMADQFGEFVSLTNPWLDKSEFIT